MTKFVIPMLLLFAAPAMAQPWAEAIARRDFVVAADLLHAIAVSPDDQITADPEALLQLAALYEQGSGVRREPVLACSLSIFADLSAQVEPPADAAPGVVGRYFVELFFWQGGEADGEPVRLFQWQVLELQGEEVKMTEGAELHRTYGTVWWRPALPAEIESRLTLQMIRSGHVRWRLATTPSRHGWIMLPEGREP